MAATTKEVARHVLHRLGLVGFLETVSGRNKAYLAHDNVADRFSHIYRDAVWRRGKTDVPLSGEGSSLEATEILRAELPRLLKRLGARSMLDLGCGDFTWMSEVDLRGIQYFGADIVPDVIARNQNRFDTAERTFIVANGIVDDLPSADVILCREVLFHLSFADAKSLLRKALATGAQHFLLTTDSMTRVNSDIRTGDFRVLNLMAGPFRLPEPSVSIAESQSLSGRTLGLWPSEDVRRAMG